MAHCFIVGRSGSGKTFLAVRLASALKKSGKSVIVLNPVAGSQWDCDYQTDDPEKFIAVVKSNRNCHCFVDEAGMMVGLHPSKEMLWTALVSRNLGHRFYYISQRVLTVARNVRDQCSEFYVFKLSLNDAKELSESEADPKIIQAASLPRFEYLHCRAFNVRHCKLKA